MNNASNIEQIEVTIDEAREAIELAKALERLNRNKDFKKVILKAYFEEDAQRLVLLKAAPAMQETKFQERILNDMEAIGGLYQYFLKIKKLGEMAESSLSDHEDTRTELLAEDV